MRLSAVELDVVWSTAELGRLPYPLDVPSVGETGTERARIFERTQEDLTGRGLWGRRGPDPDLVGLLNVLAAPEWSVDGVGFLRGGFRTLGAVQRGQGALAVLRGDSIEFHELRATAVVDAVVAVLPEAEAGPGQALSLQMSEVAEMVAEESDGGDDEDEDVFMRDRRPGRGGDRGALAALAEERLGGGQFGVTVGRSRLPVLVSWFDTPQGRYLAVRGKDGWLSVAPADNPRIARRVGELLESVKR